MSDFDSETMSQSSEGVSQASESLSEEFDQNSSNSDSEMDELESQLEPYQEEPLAPPDYEEQAQGNDDPDGIMPQTLADREDGVIAIENW